jgi:fatty acid synthase
MNQNLNPKIKSILKKVGDLEEVPGLASVFCTNRDHPLPIGSLKSNMGHSEGASTTASIVKSLLAFENRKLFPNLHLKNLRSGIAAFENNQMQVIDQVTDFHGSLIAINSFGVGGANVHLLLKANDKEKKARGDGAGHGGAGHAADGLERLLLWSGRTQDATDTIFDSIAAAPLDDEHLSLLQHSQEQTTALNTFRGFAIFDPKTATADDNARCVTRDVTNYLDGKRPVVFVYSGMGSQWPSMVSDLMRIPVFAASIEKCHDLLAAKGIDLKHILASPQHQLNVLHSYVAIAAMQIALTDVLFSIGVRPDHIVGHSVGELACGYADGCNDANEVLFAAYCRGVATMETKTVRGAMAAVGMGYDQLKDRLVEGIEIACHNSSTSCTISGPRDAVLAFMEQLKGEGCFVKEVESSGVAFHSSYIAPMGPRLLQLLKQVIPEPRERSAKWISSSVAKGGDGGRLASAEYHTNNLLSPVLFEEALAELPEKCLTIEIAPCGLLQAVLKRALVGGVHFSLTKRDEKENVMVLLTSLGK